MPSGIVRSLPERSLSWRSRGFQVSSPGVLLCPLEGTLVESLTGSKADATVEIPWEADCPCPFDRSCCTRIRSS